MKITRRGAPGRLPPGVGRSTRPQWLIEWLKDQGRYVLLKCGHKEDLNMRGTAVIVGNDDAVACDQCRQWVQVEKSIGLLEYMGIVIPPKQNDTPMF